MAGKTYSAMGSVQKATRRNGASGPSVRQNKSFSGTVLGRPSSGGNGSGPIIRTAATVRRP
jgi:hypothetical protein